MNSPPRILVMTPVDRIKGIAEALARVGKVHYCPDPSIEEVMLAAGEVEGIFTNPNKSRVFLSREILEAAKNLKVICTASTGTNHIDMAFAAQKGITVLSLTEERETINKISSTAEHAFALFLSTIRRIPQGHDSVLQGHWDYEPFVGRQISALCVAVIGYGRLGRMFAGYARAFGARVLACDPYQRQYDSGVEAMPISEVLKNADVISLHVHVNPETTRMINRESLSMAKESLLLVNTSRGEIVDEAAMVNFLKTRPLARYATDVIAGEIQNRLASPILEYAAHSKQVIITPHIGGMTEEAQQIAYGRAVERLTEFFLGNLSQGAV